MYETTSTILDVIQDPENIVFGINILVAVLNGTILILIARQYQKINNQETVLKTKYLEIVEQGQNDSNKLIQNAVEKANEIVNNTHYFTIELGSKLKQIEENILNKYTLTMETDINNQTLNPNQTVDKINAEVTARLSVIFNNISSDVEKKLNAISLDSATVVENTQTQVQNQVRDLLQIELQNIKTSFDSTEKYLSTINQTIQNHTTKIEETIASEIKSALENVDNELTTYRQNQQELLYQDSDKVLQTISNRILVSMPPNEKKLIIMEMLNKAKDDGLFILK